MRYLMLLCLFITVPSFAFNKNTLIGDWLCANNDDSNIYLKGIISYHKNNTSTLIAETFQKQRGDYVVYVKLSGNWQYKNGRIYDKNGKLDFYQVYDLSLKELFDEQSTAEFKEFAIQNMSKPSDYPIHFNSATSYDYTLSDGTQGQCQKLS